MSGGGSGGTQTTQTVQQADPWVGQQPYLSYLFNEAQRLYTGGQPQYFPGTTVAPPTQATVDAQNYLQSLSGPTLQNQAQMVTGAQNYALRAPDIRNNEALQGGIQAAIQPAVRAFETSVMPSIRADFGGGDNYGSSRRAIATGLASEALAQNIFNTAATMGSTAYGQGLEAQSRAIALTPQVLQSLYAPATASDVVGQQQRQYQQDLINANVQRWNYEQMAPWQSLAQFQQFIQGGYGGTSTGEVTSPTPQGNRALGAIGGAMSGYALASALGVANPILGGIAGLVLGGMFS
jgi:hypothetical protein